MSRAGDGQNSVQKLAFLKKKKLKAEPTIENYLLFRKLHAKIYCLTNKMTILEN